MGQPTGDFRQDGLRPRSGEVATGRLLLAVGTPEGSEARRAPDDWQPAVRRAEQRPRSAAALGPSPSVGPLALGAGPTDLPPVEREADVAELLGKLAEGRSIRLVGQAGSGRSALLAAVAEAAGGIAPDGVIRLNGHRRTAADLRQALFEATHWAPEFRPDERQLTEHLAGVGAVVVIDDLACLPDEVEALFALAPQCAFLVAGPADGEQPRPGSRLEEHPVGGLSRAACLALTARLAGRALDDTERAWAVDLWFESEGLPLRFVQAAALLRQRDVGVDALVAAREDRSRVFGMVEVVGNEDDPAELESELRRSVPLPTVAEAAAPALRLAEGLSEPAQQVLRLAVAFGGECPTAPHLSALIDVSLGESALRELVDCGLAVSVGGHHRLTTGALALIGPSRQIGDIAFGAAQHFSWWVGHASVTTAQIAAEADVLIGALLADRAAGRPDAVLQLARAAAPALALALRWGAWERALQLGLEAARRLESAVDEAWFHHELGVYALCTGGRARATTELHSAVALRATIGELRGSAGARRMLDLLHTESLQLAPAAAELPPVGRRPVIRALSQVPLRFPVLPAVGQETRRIVLVGSAAVLAVGVLGTSIGLAVAGPDRRGRDNRPGHSIEDGTLPGSLSFSQSPLPDSPSPSPSPSSASALPSPSASASPSETASPSASRTSHQPTKPPTTTVAPPPTTVDPSPSAPVSTTTSASPTASASPSCTPSTPSASPASGSPTPKC